MFFIGDAIFPGSNENSGKVMRLDTVCVRDPADTENVIAAIVAYQKAGRFCRGRRAGRQRGRPSLATAEPTRPMSASPRSIPYGMRRTWGGPRELGVKHGES